jgi:hypothetical protein
MGTHHLPEILSGILCTDGTHHLPEILSGILCTDGLCVTTCLRFRSLNQFSVLMCACVVV